ncbi:MAG: pyridoxine 5'-phosphate synthase [bacterium (Candidatus Stahlbacteria) CG23_combo_of_CG06-09_8_20_14_all_34_7]|nr:MAG: pyridoxine 5'-phosphate synthase [bacterium (Candidatus Stahlbacteria) CG23_combo_of_CG06-09_8_20_14_all_34_7]
MLLGVNIDHVATVREARKSFEPDLITAAVLAQLGGADGITVHLRQDRRHIQEQDIIILKTSLSVPLNVEVSASGTMVDFICNIKPDKVCLVPENPSEITTEGGLNLKNKNVYKQISKVIRKLQKNEIEVSLFVEPENELIDIALKLNADAIEINTKEYSESESVEQIDKSYKKLVSSVNYAFDKKLIVNMGHGLTYDNVSAIAKIERVTELNIGHTIIAKAIFYGIENAVKMMRKEIDKI